MAATGRLKMKLGWLLVVLASLVMSCGYGVDTAEPDELATSQSALTATCDGKFHWVGVTGTTCLDGTATGFEYSCTNAANPIIVYLESGGACWDADTCSCALAANQDSNGTCCGNCADNVLFGCNNNACVHNAYMFSPIQQAHAGLSLSNDGISWSDAGWDYFDQQVSTGTPATCPSTA